MSANRTHFRSTGFRTTDPKANAIAQGASVEVSVYSATFGRDRSTSDEFQGRGFLSHSQAVYTLNTLLYPLGSNVTMRIEVVEDNVIVIGYEGRLRTDEIPYAAPAPRDHHWFVYEFRA